MFYIPSDWLRNKNNETVVHSILNKYLYSDLSIDITSAINELNDIGETIIIEKLNDGTIKVK